MKKKYLLFISIILFFLTLTCSNNFDSDNFKSIDTERSGNKIIEIKNSLVHTSSAIWPDTNLIDNNYSNTWSSYTHSSSNETEWIAFWFENGYNDINYIKLIPRYHNKALGFPENFTIYWSDGSNWNEIRTINKFPSINYNRPIVLSFPYTVNTNGIHIVATKLGNDDVGNFVFQLNEAIAGYDPVFEKLKYLGNYDDSGVTIHGMDYSDGLIANPSIENPIIKGYNLYAPDLVKNGSIWNIYYGGWKTYTDTRNGNDRIYFAVSDDNLPEGHWSGQNAIIDKGSYLHVNDPSVQKVTHSLWVMAFTVAHWIDPNKPQTSDNYRDWIAISISSDGASWSPTIPSHSIEINIIGANFTDIARPSLVWTGNNWKLWFDGKIDEGGLHSYLSESYEIIPKNFVLVHTYPDRANFPSFFEPDVEFINGKYHAVIQHGYESLYKMESSDGINFSYLGTILNSNSPTFPREKVSNPSLIYDSESYSIKGVCYGMAGQVLIDHYIGFAYYQYKLSLLTYPELWHVYTYSKYYDRSNQLTYGHDLTSRINISDPISGNILLDVNVDSIAGDHYQFIP